MPWINRLTDINEKINALDEPINGIRHLMLVFCGTNLIGQPDSQTASQPASQAVIVIHLVDFG